MSTLAERPTANAPMGPHGHRLPPARAVRYNPTAEELQALTSRMPQARRTSFGNYNVQTKVVSRSKESTYLVTDDPAETTGKAISREEAARVASLQDAYVAGTEMLVIDGFLGNDPEQRSRVRLYIEEANANIAGMQQQLYFPPDAAADEWQPELSLIYTPNLPMPGYPDERLISVDLEAGVTRVMNSDYFGESKKGGLRMWNALVYERGGLAMHAGCKVVPTDAGERTMLIIGLSGTGKTTTTFTRQNNSQPVQDDFIGLFAGGKVVGTENGCFAKTFGLDPAHEPAIHGAVVKPDAYLENVSQREPDGPVDFFDTSYTKNGRATFPMASLGIWRDPREIGPVNHLLILNRNDNIIPAVARLSREQAAAYFMLGETQGTSAGGAAEEGRALRVPGTNPFYPHRDEQQANRFLELMASCDFDVFLLNTGRVGGTDGVATSKKVAIEHSGAIVKGIAEGTIQWERDADFGYEVATGLPGIDDLELLQPRRLYERTGRADEYRGWVARLRAERIEFLQQYAGLLPEILAAVE
ncbi:MAG TPA: phosphoenolpyruvate carboxykinase [Candidatus Limnocylindria bacterium]|jgi:phosphoenolpyruvate carboxykinase (ATP)|nr:phosphoenolpyruvate carboxykinase [Candidatus Limnocylindria bacterium]